MQNITNIFKKTALMIIAAVLSTGCIFEKYEVSGLQNVMIMLNVSSEGEITKATEAPTSDEMKINTLRIYAFHGNRLCGHYYQGTAYDGPILMDLELPDGESDVDFYLIANEAEMAYENGLVRIEERMTRAQLESLKFTALVSRTSLPMYCRKTETINASDYASESVAAEGHQGHLKLNRQVDFLLARSLAKLSVYAAKSTGTSAEPQILKMDLVNSGTREYSYLFPQTEEILDAVPFRSNDRSLVDEPVLISKEVEKGSSAAADPANYDLVLSGTYLPEVSAGYPVNNPSYRWDISSGDDSEAVLFVEYALGEGMEIQRRYVYLPRVERNNHIKVCILINAEGQLIIQYTVAEWDMEDANMNNWFFDYPTHSYIRHNIPQTDQQLEQSPSSPAVMSETVPFIGYFQMTYPENDTWKPTLTGLEASNCSIKVYKEDQLVFTSEAPVSLPVSDKWYRIEVYPDGDVKVGEKVNLAITYTPSGLEEMEYLLINGSYNNYFWPGSDDENFVTITMVN